MFSQPPRLPNSDFVADPDNAGFDDSRGNAAVTAHRVVATLTQGFFHPRTGVTSAGAFEERATDAEASAVERKQINPPDDNIAAKEGWVDRLTSQKLSEPFEVLGLNESHLPLAFRRPGKVITRQTCAATRFYLVDTDQWNTAGGAYADPFNDASLRQTCK